MEPCRSLALLAGLLGLTSSLIALSTDFWIVATGPSSSSHSGLWPRTHEIQVAGKVPWAPRWWEWPVGSRHPQVSSCIRLYPCDTELLYPGCPVEPGVRGLPDFVLQFSPIPPRPWPSGVNYHGFCCRYEWNLGCTGTPGLVSPAVAKPALSCSCLQLSP